MQAALFALLDARDGHFELESGRHGDLWLDLDRLLLRPRRLLVFTAVLAEQLSTFKPDVVCGPLVGGAFIARSVAQALDVDFCYTERHLPEGDERSARVQYRLPDSLCRVVRDRRVAVLDDVIYAGSAVGGTLAALNACGAVPVGVAALLVLGTAAADLCARHSIPLVSIAARPNQSWAPSECPLCAADRALERPLRRPTVG